MKRIGILTATMVLTAGIGLEQAQQLTADKIEAVTANGYHTPTEKSSLNDH